jgi:alpha-1,2-mannosyltransferase
MTRLKRIVAGVILISVAIGVGIIVNPFLYKMAPAANISLPLLIWSGIFFLQPHKEERFLYPIYPLITLSAALFVSKIFALVSQISIKVIPNHKIANVASRGGKILFGALVFAVSILRILNLVENYSAPLVTLENISQLPASDRIVNVCVGKEWYHIPNSLFLPDNYRFRFVKSGFDGLLPGDFLENGELRQATSSIPTNMNNKNAFESDKVIDFLECDYYIDNSEVSRNNEPRVIERVDGIATVIDPEWKLLGCNKIIDPNGQSNGIGRLLYVPKALRSVIPYKVEYLDFCAMERKSGGA